jgi:hypothetical protein
VRGLPVSLQSPPVTQGALLQAAPVLVGPALLSAPLAAQAQSVCQ